MQILLLNDLLFLFVSDISLIFKLWEPKEDDRNPHLTQMGKTLKQIFAPLTELRFTASEEERELIKVIGKLRAIEEEEKTKFIAHLEESRRTPEILCI